ncbi:hypothetical protein M0811_13598 [Anaeramoeba ignava]|uniref:Uncharacterized protein n=1 Tax=Anaeramoeba ignava TaxID=1746090 RepID=A0A9Q0L827_ANAIG|nr:hypothetical protein M0811_13598 [Anaeramoeba ignava]
MKQNLKLLVLFTLFLSFIISVQNKTEKSEKPYVFIQYISEGYSVILDPFYLESQATFDVYFENGKFLWAYSQEKSLPTLEKIQERFQNL